MSKVSRLWRRLGLTAPLFNVWSEEDPEFQMTDHDLKSITINRGSANGGFGEQDHTLEVNSSVYRSVSTGYPIHCDLTGSGAQRLVDLVGGSTDSIRKRYFGRIGRQSVDDAGGIADVEKWHTNFYASKWQSQLRNSDRVGNQINGERVMYLFEHFMFPTVSALDYLPDPEFPNHWSHYGVMINDLELGAAKIPYSQFAARYFEAPGYYVKNMRAGQDRVMTIDRRWTEALDRLESHYPLLRSQVLTTAQWDQPNEDRPSNHTVIYRDTDGNLLRRTRGPDTNDVRIPLKEHDVSYIGWAIIDQPTRMLTVRYSRERTDTGYRVPTLEIDLLPLIDSDSIPDRAQARQLLQLEMGDPVFLSNDWHHQLRGIHFANGITEKITPDSWTITLSLIPSIAVVGYWPIPVTPVTWDSARIWWENATNTWNEAIEYED